MSFVSARGRTWRHPTNGGRRDRESGICRESRPTRGPPPPGHRARELDRSDRRPPAAGALVGAGAQSSTSSPHHRRSHDRLIRSVYAAVPDLGDEALSMDSIRALLLMGGQHDQPFYYAELAGILAGEGGVDLRI